jgi:hypothetical protein
MAMTKKEKAAAKARRARNKFRGINVTDAAIGYGGLAIWTDALFRVDPVQFITDKGGGRSSYKITVREIFDSVMGGAGGVAANTATGLGINTNAFAMIERNAKTYGLNAIGKSIVYGAATNIGKKVTTKPRAFLNRQLKNLQMEKWIKF